MPEGSSSAAPVVRPGPKLFQNWPALLSPLLTKAFGKITRDFQGFIQGYGWGAKEFSANCFSSLGDFCVF